MQYNYNTVKNILKKYKLILLEKDYINCKQKLLCEDIDGYKIYVNLDHLMNRGSIGYRFHKSNNYTIYNINHFAELNKLTSRCIADSYIHSKQKLSFKCECGNIFDTTRNNFLFFHKIKCDKCTGYNSNLTYNEVKSNLEAKGYFLEISKMNFME